MSVLVWDGKTLATDRAANDGLNRWPIEKMWMRGDKIVAAIGVSSYVTRFLNWYDDQAAHKFPAHSPGNVLNAVVLTEKGLFRYLPSGEVQDHGFNAVALGEGRDFAYGALALGHTSIEAVRAANKYCLHCGLGVVAYNLNLKTFGTFE